MSVTPDSVRPLLSVIIPMYNEQEGLEALFARLTPLLDEIGGWEIICVDDGSSDNTFRLLCEFHRGDARIKTIRLSRNFGKEHALTAGIAHSIGQAVIPLDSDLQDPPELIGQMVQEWRKGNKVVLATRRSRPGDSWLKAFLAQWFYRGINAMSTVPIPANTGDFRLMDRRVVEEVERLPERSRFMKGLFAWVGFSTTVIYYDRPQRHAGTTRWSFWKLWKLALDGIFAFTTLPLRVWMYLGALISLVSFVYACLLIARALWFGADLPGYTSLMVVILFLGGIQLISLGIIGEYVGRIYREAKQRPLYVVEERVGLGTK